MCAMKFVLYTGKVSKHYALKVITSEIFFFKVVLSLQNDSSTCKNIKVLGEFKCY